MINRAVLILKYKETAIKWINDSESYKDSQTITSDDINNDSTVYLVSEEDSESQETLNAWLELNYTQLFKSELSTWYSDENDWPQERTFALFNQWFNAECHTIIVDTVDGPIRDDDT